MHFKFKRGENVVSLKYHILFLLDKFYNFIRVLLEGQNNNFTILKHDTFICSLYYVDFSAFPTLIINILYIQGVENEQTFSNGSTH